MNETFQSLLHSELSCAGVDVVQQLVANSLAHAALGMGVTLLVIFRGWPVWLLWLGLSGVVAKELAGDIPNGGFAALVALDSLWDVVCYLGGFLAVFCALRAPAGGGT